MDACGSDARDLRNARTSLAAGSRADTGVETTNPSLSGHARFLAFEEEPNQFSGATEPRQVFRVQLLD